MNISFRARPPQVVCRFADHILFSSSFAVLGYFSAQRSGRLPPPPPAPRWWFSESDSQRRPLEKTKESPAALVRIESTSPTSILPHESREFHLNTTVYPSDYRYSFADEDSNSKIGKYGYGHGVKRTPERTATDAERLCWCSWSCWAAAVAVTSGTARFQSHAQQPNTRPPKL